MNAEFLGAARAAGTGLKVLDRLRGLISTHTRLSDEAQYARELLGLASPESFSYRVAAHHPVYNVGDPHPDDRAAFATVLRHAVSPTFTDADITSTPSVSCHADDGHVLVGSPEGEPFAQAIFGYRPSEHGSEYLGDTLELPFRWEEDRRQVAASYAKFVPGRGAVTRPNWPIVVQGPSGERRLSPRLDLDGFNVNDWLILTRIPNIASMAGLDSGRHIVSIAGAHGTATRAVELLLTDRRALAAIGRAVHPRDDGFQALIEVSDIVHDPVLGSRARQIRVDQVVPLRFNHRVLSAATRIVSQRWQERLSTLRADVPSNQVPD